MCLFMPAYAKYIDISNCLYICCVCHGRLEVLYELQPKVLDVRRSARFVGMTNQIQHRIHKIAN